MIRKYDLSKDVSMVHDQKIFHFILIHERLKYKKQSWDCLSKNKAIKSFPNVFMLIIQIPGRF